MRSIGIKYIAKRAATYTCLVIVGVGISDQLFRNGSFFQTAGAQQVRQFPSPANAATSAAAANSGHPPNGGHTRRIRHADSVVRPAIPENRPCSAGSKRHGQVGQLLSRAGAFYL